MDLAEIEERENSLRKKEDLTPVEAMSRANEIVKAINKVVEVQVEEKDYKTVEELYEKAADTYLLAAEKVPRESRDKVAFPANFWSMRARHVRLMIRKPSAPRFKAAPISKPLPEHVHEMREKDPEKTSLEPTPLFPEGFFNDLFDEIEMLIRLSSNEKNSLRETPSKSCSITNVTDLSRQIGVNEELIESYFEAIKKDPDLKQKLGEDNYDRVIGREYDVELVGAIFLDLKHTIGQSKTVEGLKKEIFNTVERSAERNSLNNFIRCDEKSTILKGVLKTLVDAKDAFKFVVSIIRSRVGIPHYESTIIAFHMARYMLNNNGIESNIDKNKVEKFLTDDLELLITELKLRDIMFNKFKNVAESFVKNEINREGAHNLIMRVLEIYVNTLNITRLRFS